MLERLDGHIVVCGGGRMGQQVMKELLALGQDFVVPPGPTCSGRLRGLC